ncbi:MAG: hypothetical protein ACRC3H_21960 [Lachnospiraceae bacterium]
MDSIVLRLSEIEDTASAIVENAQSEKSSLEKEMQEKRNKFDLELEAQTKEKLANIQADLDAKSAEILKSQELINSKSLNALEEDFDQNHERYAQEIFRHIIEG